MSAEQLWTPTADMNLPLYSLVGAEIVVVCEHDDGEQIRKHKKKRINKKWRKRYGVYHEPLKKGQIIAHDGKFLMSRSTYKHLMAATKKYNNHPFLVETNESRRCQNPGFCISADQLRDRCRWCYMAWGCHVRGGFG